MNVCSSRLFCNQKSIFGFFGSHPSLPPLCLPPNLEKACYYWVYNFWNDCSNVCSSHRFSAVRVVLISGSPSIYSLPMTTAKSPKSMLCVIIGFRGSIVVRSTLHQLPVASYGNPVIARYGLGWSSVP